MISQTCEILEVWSSRIKLGLEWIGFELGQKQRRDADCVSAEK